LHDGLSVIALPQFAGAISESCGYGGGWNIRISDAALQLLNRYSWPEISDPRSMCTRRLNTKLPLKLRKILRFTTKSNHFKYVFYNRH
jgi:hypothetical protein